MRRQTTVASDGGTSVMVGAKAFTLIETLIVLVIVALISGALLPVVTRPYVAERQVEAMYEMAAIQAAISGRPEEGQFGFIGDVGALGGSIDPLAVIAASDTLLQPGLNALMVPGSTTQASIGDSTSDAPGIVVGWNGPYIRPRFSTPLIDPWGSTYQLERDTTDNSRWRIRCLGPDRKKATDDDIVFPAATDHAYFESQGSVTIELLKTNDFAQWPFDPSQLSEYTVSMSPKNASPSVDCTQEAGTNRFACTKTWFGQHQVMVFKTISGTPKMVAYKTVVLNAPKQFVQVSVPLEGTVESTNNTCAQTSTTWTTSPAYSTALKGFLTAEGAFCAVKPAVKKYQNMNVSLSGFVTPEMETTECSISLRMRTEASATAWPVAGPIKVKGTTVAVPFSLSGNVIAPTSAATGGVVTIYATVEASGGGSCTAEPISAPVGTTPGTVVVLGHP